MCYAGLVSMLPAQVTLSIMNTNAFAPTTRAHTSETFQFHVPAPMAVAFPLFGAHRERQWAPDWEPEFIWPSPPTDRSGMVFTVAHGARQAIWVNTDFDPVAGHVRYISVLPEVMTTVITLQLREHEAGTHVEVRYERTSLNAAADERIRELAREDAQAGPEWASQIAKHLADRPVR